MRWLTDKLLQWLINRRATDEWICIPRYTSDGWSHPERCGEQCAQVRRIGGMEYVSARVLRTAAREIEHCRYWIKRLGLEGNSERLRRIEEFLKLSD